MSEKQSAPSSSLQHLSGLLDGEKSEARYFVNPVYHACPGDSSVVRVINPATQASVGTRQVTGSDTIAAVIIDANVAQTGWAKLDAKARAAQLHKIADSIESSDPAVVSALLTREMGKPYPESVGEIMNCSSIFRYYAELARHDAGKVAGTTTL